MQAIICGLGGQGVITLNETIGKLACRLGLEVISAETHGMAMRGGSVYTSIKIGSSLCPTIAAGSADVLISTDAQEVLRNIHFLKKDGVVITDGTLDYELPFEVISISAKKEAIDKFGGVFHAGTILLGALAARFNNIFPIEKSIEILTDNKKINIDALKLGIEKVSK